MIQVSSLSAYLAENTQEGQVMGMARRLSAGIKSFRSRGFDFGDVSVDGEGAFEMDSLGGFWSDRAWKIRLTPDLHSWRVSTFDDPSADWSVRKLGTWTMSVRSPKTQEWSSWEGAEGDPEADALWERARWVRRIDAARRINQGLWAAPEGWSPLPIQQLDWSDIHGGTSAIWETEEGIVILEDDPFGRAYIKGPMWELDRTLATHHL